MNTRQMSDEELLKALIARRKKRQSSPLLYALFWFALIPLLVLIFAILAERYTNPASSAINKLFYADPARADHEPVNRDWLTPYPEGWLKTPENLQAVLSKTPVTIAPTLPPPPTATSAPTATHAASATPEPSPTYDQGPQMSATAKIEAAKAELEIEKLQTRAARTANLMEFIARGFAYICLAGGSVGAVVLLILVIARTKNEIAGIQARAHAAALLADPVLHYPESTQAEVRGVYELLLANKTYYEQQQINSLEQKQIRRFSDLEGINSLDWTKATDSLVRRNYAMKSERRPTLLKYSLTLGIMLEIVSRGLYLDRDALYKIVAPSPSPTAN